MTTRWIKTTSGGVTKICIHTATTSVPYDCGCVPEEPDPDPDPPTCTLRDSMGEADYNLLIEAINQRGANVQFVANVQLDPEVCYSLETLKDSVNTILSRSRYISIEEATFYQPIASNPVASLGFIVAKLNEMRYQTAGGGWGVTFEGKECSGGGGFESMSTKISDMYADCAARSVSTFGGYTGAPITATMFARAEQIEDAFDVDRSVSQRISNYVWNGTYQVPSGFSLPNVTGVSHFSSFVKGGEGRRTLSVDGCGTYETYWEFPDPISESGTGGTSTPDWDAEYISEGFGFWQDCQSCFSNPSIPQSHFCSSIMAESRILRVYPYLTFGYTIL